jgi:hypothetical protein
MDKIVLLGFLIAATSLEATGDALVRLGINQNQWLVRCLLFVAGAILLFGYGLSVNLAPVDFGRVVGLYIAMLFIMWQTVNWIAFRKKTEEPAPIQQDLGSGACARDRPDEIVLLSALARSFSDRLEFVIYCRCRKVAAEIRGRINPLLKLNGRGRCRCVVLGRPDFIR